MKDSIKKRRKNLLALCLSVMMFSSVAGLAACGGDETDSSASDSSSSSSSEMTSEVKDTGLIKNAGFEIANEDNVMNTSITGWQRSTNAAASGTAAASQAASGIIDLNKDAWHMLTGSNYDDPEQVKKLTEEEAEEAWDSLTVRDRIAYGDQWKADNKDGNINESLKFYKKPNIFAKDIPTIAHFDTHDKAAEKGLEDTKVLMIHNENPAASSTTATQKAIGTAQKYTSSSTVTVKAGTAAEFSVWVRTQDLQSSATDGSAQEAVDKGAYISVTHSVGGQTLDDFIVENINTENMAADELTNGWKQYTFLLKGASYADTTFSLVLGLGQGGGSYRGEYVNGYAFFDDIQCKAISYDDYDKKDPADLSFGFDAEGENKIVNAAIDKADKFELNFYGEFLPLSSVLENTTAAPTTTEAKDGTVYTTVAGNVGGITAPWLSGGFSKERDTATVFTNGVKPTENAADPLSKVYEQYFKGKKFENDQTLLLLSMDGVAYSAESSYKFTFSENQKYIAVSFFVKTSNLNGYTGAGITLIDGENKTSFSAIDTSSIAPVEVEGNDDLYDGWQQCFFFVENTSDNKDATFTLSFNLGVTAIEEGTAKDSYHPGFAAFTNFTYDYMSEEAFERVQGNTYAKVVSVTEGKKDVTEGSNDFDTPKGTPTGAIEQGIAKPQNYTGVNATNAYITGNGNLEATANDYAGLISKEYFTAEDGYFDNNASWMKALAANAAEADRADASKVWDAAIGKNSTQPLLIYTPAATANEAYGFIGKSTSISANSYKTVSVRVKGTTNAKASIYLVDTDSTHYGFTDKTYNKTLSIGRTLTYWYDDNGNICTGDPADKATQVAFKLQTNGLYKANESWDGYASLENKDAWYANLSAYDVDPETKNKVVASGGASHNYSNYWNNEGMDGVAYYYKDGGYYADRACTLAVTDLTVATALKPRYTAIDGAANALMAENITLSATEWTTVTFYIHTGDLAKNYRLEVWSGARTGAGNAEGSYVIFDTNTPPSDESNFTSLIESYKDKVADTDKFEGAFSYFDTASYLRYNASLDENGVGNLYEENYVPSTSAEGIAYLKYVDGAAKKHTVFVDYQYSEKTVAATVESEDTEEETTEEEEEDDGTNIWLLISSLAIAGVLIVAVGSIVVRKAAAKARKKRAAQGSVKKVKKAKKAKKEKKEKSK